MSDRSEHINNLYDLRDEMIHLVALDGKDREKYIQSVIFAINSLEVDEAYQFMYEETFSKWIPVTERLPEPFTFVNATCRSLVDDREDWVVETIYLPIPKETNKRGYSDWGNIPMLNLGEAEVIAWVERIIPQPYKAESEPQESEG